MLKLHMICVVLCVCVLHVFGYLYKHHNNREVLQILMNVKNACPKITTSFELTYQSAAGRKIYGIILGRKSYKHVPLIPEFKYIGGIHGNEVVGKEMLLRLAVHLCSEYNRNDPHVRQLLKTTRIHIVPELNPDGWELATTSSYADRNEVSGRTNNNSIDLNRSYPKLDNIWWSNYHTQPWQNHHLYTNFNDTLNMFEPETRAMITWLQAVPFVLSASLHGGDLVANYPFDSTSSGNTARAETPDAEVFHAIAHAYADVHPQMVGSKCYSDEPGFPDGIINGAEWYVLRGGMQDFNYFATNCFEVTLEISCEKYPPTSQLHDFWIDNKPSLMAYMWQVHMGIKGIVYDKKTGEPIPNAEIQVSKRSDKSYKMIWHFVTTAEHGDYYRLLVNGDYKVVAYKKGYMTQAARVNVENDLTAGAQIVNFALERNNVL